MTISTTSGMRDPNSTTIQRRYAWSPCDAPPDEADRDGHQKRRRKYQEEEPVEPRRLVDALARKRCVLIRYDDRRNGLEHQHAESHEPKHRGPRPHLLGSHRGVDSLAWCRCFAHTPTVRVVLRTEQSTTSPQSVGTFRERRACQPERPTKPAVQRSRKSTSSWRFALCGRCARRTRKRHSRAPVIRCRRGPARARDRSPR